MKKSDFIFWGAVILLFLPFFLSSNVYGFYKSFNHDHGMVTAFVKFAILATMGELIGLRIKTGEYIQAGFGILPRAMVWGFIGLTIKLAFMIFATGTPSFLAYMGMSDATTAMKGGFGTSKLIVAFSTSFAMNIIYAPVMMTFHKMSDIHIVSNGGTLRGFLKPMKPGKVMSEMNWQVMWGFVFKKTIPFFWIPAHTITFLLPPDMQVLFAALLGIALGTILAVAGK
ncbi:MAG: Mpv17/PMP22 family protein [Chlorobi bacterium]|nr:Mpv17/PMP22 family protein [Chlorobiota bacterium]